MISLLGNYAVQESLRFRGDLLVHVCGSALSGDAGGVGEAREGGGEAEEVVAVAVAVGDVDVGEAFGGEAALDLVGQGVSLGYS